MEISGHAAAKAQGIGDGAFPMEEERGSVLLEKAGLGPGRGFPIKQKKEPALRRLSFTLPQCLQSQKQQELFCVFMKD